MWYHRKVVFPFQDFLLVVVPMEVRPLVVRLAIAPQAVQVAVPLGVLLREAVVHSAVVLQVVAQVAVLAVVGAVVVGTWGQLAQP